MWTRALELLRVPLTAVGVERFGRHPRAEQHIEYREREEARDRLVAVDHRVMTQVEAVHLRPKFTKALRLQARRPLLQWPMLDRVENFIERQRCCQRGKPSEKPRKTRRQPLPERQQWRHDRRENRHRIPREESCLALLGLRHRVDILHIGNLASAGQLTARDAREVVVKRVLAIKPAQERDHRLVQHVAVEEKLHPAVEELHAEEDHRELPPGGVQLGLPDGLRRKRPQEPDKTGQRERHGR